MCKTDMNIIRKTNANQFCKDMFGLVEGNGMK